MPSRSRLPGSLHSKKESLGKVTGADVEEVFRNNAKKYRKLVKQAPRTFRTLAAMDPRARAAIHGTVPTFASELVRHLGGHKTAISPSQDRKRKRRAARFLSMRTGNRLQIEHRSKPGANYGFCFLDADGRAATLADRKTQMVCPALNLTSVRALVRGSGSCDCNENGPKLTWPCIWAWTEASCQTSSVENESRACGLWK